LITCTSKGHQVKDHGPHEYDAVDDYPDFCIPAAIATVADPASLGIVLGGSGNGEQIAANKVKGVRAVLSVERGNSKTWVKDHNNANVVGIGGRMHSIDECKAIIDAFIETPFSNDERHVRRINKIAKYENEGSL
jgi:ribose 5-phosphate isomerase B